MKNKNKISETIAEISGWLGLTCLFLSFWISGYFWNLFATGILLWIIIIFITIADIADEKNKKFNKIKQ